MPVSAEDDDSSPSEPSPVSTGSDAVLLSGKRKRKPKPLIDHNTPIIRHRKKKAHTSKSKQGMLENGGTLTSNRDGIVCALGTPGQSKSPILVRAEEFQSRLGNEQLSFLKVLVR